MVIIKITTEEKNRIAKCLKDYGIPDFAADSAKKYLSQFPNVNERELEFMVQAFNAGFTSSKSYWLWAIGVALDKI